MGEHRPNVVNQKDGESFYDSIRDAPLNNGAIYFATKIVQPITNRHSDCISKASVIYNQPKNYDNQTWRPAFFKIIGDKKDSGPQGQNDYTSIHNLPCSISSGVCASSGMSFNASAIANIW